MVAEYEIVEFFENGRAKRPVVPYDEIDIRLPLLNEDNTDIDAATTA
jgi:predicted transcriptional regulator